MKCVCDHIFNPTRYKMASLLTKRNMGLEFIDYLKELNLIRTWYKPDLALYYEEFLNERRKKGLGACYCTFPNILLALSEFETSPIMILEENTIVFRGTEDFRPSSTPTVRKLFSQHVDIRPTSDRTVEWKPGCIRRQFTDMRYSFIELELFNTRMESVCLESCTVLSRPSYYKAEFNAGVLIKPFATEKISVRPTEDDKTQTTEIEICLQTDTGNREKIFRYLRFESDETQKAEQESHEQPQTACNFVSFAEIIRGEKPGDEYQNQLVMEWALPNDTVPQEMKFAVQRVELQSSNESASMSDQYKHAGLTEPLSKRSYRTKFKMLIHVEEYQNQLDIRRYDLKKTPMSIDGELLYLNVPGLAEKRPSLLRGDRVYAKMHCKGVLESAAYEGYVHHVEENRVALGFAEEFCERHLNNQRYFIRFDFNRSALRLMERACCEIMSRRDSTEILFPTRRVTLTETKSLKLYNRRIESNPEQLKAVEMIVSGNTRKVFIIFGPPGTGKTITMVEAIHQLLRSNNLPHILVCAPSNNACDWMTNRLLKHVETREIFRMHAPSRDWSEVPRDVKGVSNHSGEEFVYPAKKCLKKFRIIVTTLITAGRIASASFPNDHFNYVFIDEAGQAMEPEAMIAVAGVLAHNGKIVMSGDPRQLGPVVRSAMAVSNGLQLSILERLMTKSKIYSKRAKGYDPTSIVKLLKNYRSHESIIHVPNELFYDNEIQVCADLFERNSLSSWDILPQKEFPIIFYGVQGNDRQDPNSVSYYNAQEVKQVKYYVDELLNKRGTKVRPEDIGIISPYRLQVLKIRHELKRFTDIKVGNVEDFQGQERRVIIVSTVRSNIKHLKVDARFNLGILNNPKRFNVAVTRAKALLIIVGNPRILCYDKQWCELLRYCKDSGGYVGVSVDIDSIVKETATSKVLTDMNDLTLKENRDDEPNMYRSNPQWRQDP